MQTELKAVIKKLRAAVASGGKIKFLTPQFERIYYSTKYPERVESAKRDSLMKKWSIAYISKEREFEETFDLYVNQWT